MLSPDAHGAVWMDGMRAEERRFLHAAAGDTALALLDGAVSGAAA